MQMILKLRWKVTNSFEETVKTMNIFGKKSDLFLNAGKPYGEILLLNICHICKWNGTHLNLRYLVYGLITT